MSYYFYALMVRDRSKSVDRTCPTDMCGGRELAIPQFESGHPSQPVGSLAEMVA